MERIGALWRRQIAAQEGCASRGSGSDSDSNRVAIDSVFSLAAKAGIPTIRERSGERMAYLDEN